MTGVILADGDRIDETGFGDIRVIQRRGFGYGVDAVLLAAFAAGETGCRGVSPGASVADLGTDCGIVAFVMAHKIPGTRYVGFEKRPDAVRRAEAACEMNGLRDRVRFAECDIADLAGSSRSETKLHFDAVVTNPPYFRKAAAIPSSSDDRYTARHETTADIRDFARAAAAMLPDGGSLYMVHRPDRLADIITAMRGCGIEPKEMQMVVPVPGAAANIVLIRGARGAGPELRMLPEIAVRDAGGNYTELIERLYERDRR